MSLLGNQLAESQSKRAIVITGATLFRFELSFPAEATDICCEGDLDKC